jgi:hypothetical protein
MKQIHLRREPVRKRLIRSGLSLFFLLTLSFCLPAQSLVPELVFMNPRLKTGPGYPGAGKDGAVYLFSNVGVGVDAEVSILGRSDAKVSLSDMDLKGSEQDPVNGTGYDNAWQPKVSYAKGNAPAHSSWWMEFRISFVKHNDPGQPVPVNQFFVSGLDIDGDGGRLHEFQTFYKMQYFTLEQHTDINVSSVKGCLADPHLEGKRFDGPVKNYAGISTAVSSVSVSNFYINGNSLVLRVGAETGSTGSTAADRMYSLWFKSLTYDVPVSAPLPLTLIAFNAQWKNKEVNLSWTTTMEQNLSHFTLQRSFDGQEFDDAAVLFTDGNSDVQKHYRFTDHPDQVSSPLIYYRLKLVDLDSKYRYSGVVMVKTDRNGLQRLMVYPNPVAGELRITIPDSWQSKAVSYKVYNSAGVLMRQRLNDNAGQTEILHVADLPAGIYILRTENGKETATQKFIKSDS